ncbi:PHP domain-containing protein [candidate division KSB1 bacterium]|nr:PHP domain-containing protein [candidate division KSB1 bacterium]
MNHEPKRRRVSSVTPQKADLHIHSNFSDGKLSPEEIFLLAQKFQLRAISITDHDNVAALNISKNLAQQYDIEFIPGIEISCRKDRTEIHILGYFIDPDNVQLNSYLKYFQNERMNRARQILHRLRQCNIIIDWEELKSRYGERSIGRPHIAEILIEKNCVKNHNEAFEKYLGDDCPCYIPKYKITPSEAITIIKEANGISFIAHPGVDIELQGLRDLIALGIDGIETVHPRHSIAQIERYKQLVKQYDLQESGGSDYHGDKKLGPAMGSFTIPYEIVIRLTAYHSKLQQ